MADPDLKWGGPADGASIAERGCILRTVVGSQVHGLTNPGTDDRDEMAIAIEPPENVIGLHPRFEHWSYRTQPEGRPSGPGDLDLIVYSLRRYCELALKGSPTVLLPLFAPPEHTLICTDLGEELRAQAELFLIASNARDSFLGYLEAQRRSLLDRSRSRNRELSPEHGYDTKYAMHAIRVGYQGLELLHDGRITLPIAEPQRSRLMDIRGGDVPLQSILEELDELIEGLNAAPVRMMQPPADLSLELWVVDAYQRHWKENWIKPVLE